MYNKLTISGNLTRDPELRTINTATGEISVCNFTVATNDWRQPHKNGEVVPQFFRVTTWRDHAEKCKQYLSKGRAVICEGAVSLRIDEVDGRTYANMEMQNANVTFLPDGRNNSNGGSGQASVAAQPAIQPNYDADAQPAAQNGYTEIDDNDLPF